MTSGAETIDLRSNTTTCYRKTVPRTIDCIFGFVLAIIVIEIYQCFSGTVFQMHIRPLTLFCDVTVTSPDLGPAQNFAHIFPKCLFEAMQSYAFLP